MGVNKMAEMKPRERVMAALNHEEPDRIPIDIGGGLSTTLVVEGYENLKKHFGVSTETQLMSKMYRLVKIDERIMERLGSDVRPLQSGSPENWSPPSSEPGTFVDVWGVKFKAVYYSDTAFYYEVADPPLKEADVKDLDRYPWPDPDDPGYTKGLNERVKELFTETDYAIMADSGFKALWEEAYQLRGFEQLLTDLITNPKFVTALLERILDINMKATGKFLDIAGPYIQVFRTADDMATQEGPLMSPKTYREIIKPIYKRWCDFIRSKTEAKIFYHSDGNVVALLDEFIEIGVDILNPVQVSAIGDITALKRDFGEKLSFWGGIDTQKVMPYGSREDVTQEVKKRIQELGPGGGYVMSSVHAIQPDVSPENIVAMAEACRTYGRYPLSV
jgi:uroporphyrinogen decarboxylase